MKTINKFRRHTHDKFGNYRKELGEPYGKTDRETWVVHMLDPHKYMTFQELVDEIWSYNDQEHEDRQDTGSIALGLVRLIEQDSVEVGPRD